MCDPLKTPAPGRGARRRARPVHEGERGFSLVEMLAVVAILGLMVTFGVSAALQRTRNEQARGAAQDLRTMLAAARTEALRRDVACRFAIDTGTRVAQVIDTRGTVSTSDDVVLETFTLDSKISFAMPDSSTAVTIPNSSGNVYYVDFAATGRVTSTGQVALASTTSYARVVVAGGGALRAEWWTGSVWRQD